MTTDIKTRITPLHSFIDEAFDAKKTASYQLIIQIGMGDIQLAILDTQKNKYIALEHYDVLNAYNFEALSDIFEELVTQSKLLNHKFKDVACVIVNNLSTLVPDVLFQEDRKNTYLNFNTTLTVEESVIVDEIKSMEAKNIFAFSSSLKSKLDKQFNTIKYHHISSTLIDTLVTNNKNLTGKKIYVHVQSTHFQIVVIDGKNLIFYNTFNYNSPEDFIYYLLFVCEQLQFNPEKIEAILLGEADKTSSIYSLMNKYIRNIKFAERTVDADYSYQLQTLPKHFYFTLFNNYLA